MKLIPCGSNQNQVNIGNKAILFSYQTPVAAVDLSNGTGLALKTEKKWSRTTSKHINNWLATKSFSGIATRPQEFFDNLVK
jgi:hypothetical protein